MRRLLIIGDACCDSGFARNTHAMADALHGVDYEVGVLGLNYHGDPHPYPYKIWPAMSPRTNDFLGIKRVVPICQKFMPDVVVIQNDPWNMPAYLDELDRFTDYRPTKVGIVAIDGLNADGAALNRFDRCWFWTQFALDEARQGGYVKPGDAYPLGVDLTVYRPGDKHDAREALGLPQDAFIVLNVNRNQPRKRIDLTFECFAEWVQTHEVPNAKLMLHICPTGDFGIDPRNFARYYKLDEAANGGKGTGKLFLADPGAYHGVPEEQLAQEYQAADVYLSTTTGEGMGLTTLEAMACGLPCVVPKSSALGEWATAALRIPCSQRVSMFGGPNVIGAVPDREPIINALHTLYAVPSVREHLSRQGLQLARHPQFRWENIAKSFKQTLIEARYDHEYAEAFGVAHPRQA